MRKETLCMPFQTTLGSESNLLMVGPKAGITLAEVQAAMAVIVAKNVFIVKTGEFVTALTPSILVSDETALS